MNICIMQLYWHNFIFTDLVRDQIMIRNVLGSVPSVKNTPSCLASPPKTENNSIMIFLSLLITKFQFYDMVNGEKMPL